MAKELFTSEFFAGNRDKLRQLFTGTAPIIITANGLMQRGGDVAYPFQQDANFWYLTGINEPDVLLVMDRDSEYLIVPDRDEIRNVFDGFIDAKEFERVSGIEQVVAESDGWKKLRRRLKHAKFAATIAAPPSYLEHFAIFTNPARNRLIHRVREINSDIEVLDLSQHIIQMRMVKQEPELAAIQKAVDITNAAIATVTSPERLATYEQTFQIEADLNREFRYGGSVGHGFEPIVATGEKICTIHYLATDQPVKNGELLLLDIGAEYSHYSADISRTVSIGGAPSKRQQAVFDAVLAVQEYAMTLIKPGLTYKNYERQVEQYMGEKLRELGLVKKIEHELIRHYFPHATTHHLGLNVHDAADYKTPFEPGMVLTVEPGIYIPDEGIGVRLEDDIVVTTTGIRSLSNSLPRRLA